MIYLDNAATTKMYKEVVDSMIPYCMDYYGNPSELYDYASSSRAAVNKARRELAKLINADIDEIYFTSGGTEADNWALIGIAEQHITKGKHIITSRIEHHAILNTCRYLESRGYEITYIDVDSDGLIDMEMLKKSIRKDTVLVSVMLANNEIGTIQDIDSISEIAHSYGALFHTDAVQAFAHIPIDVKRSGIDLLSASAHKCHGPKGSGFLYIKNGVKIASFQHGGKQEKNKRAGTENVPAIVGFGEAARITFEKENNNIKRIKELQNIFIQRISNEIDLVRFNGSLNERIPGNISVSFAYLDGEAIQIQLDLHGICCSTGSACNAGEKKRSHVIEAINVPEEYAYGTLRFTFNDDNTTDEIDQTVNILVEVVNKLRKMSRTFTLS